MKVGILETGAPPAHLKSRFGSYGEMFQRLLGQSYGYARFDVRQGEYPTAAEDCDAYLLTGSAAGVHDGDAWIDTLKSFLRDISGRLPTIGICFGHQVMAEAFGGHVITSPKGWGVGLHTYDIKHRAAWMDDAQAIAIAASHRDQVVELADGAVVLAGSAFTPFGMLLYPERRAISLQCHPEFPSEYAAALVEVRCGTIYSDAQAEQAIQSLRAPNDSQRVASWIKRFMELEAG